MAGTKDSPSHVAPCNRHRSGVSRCTAGPLENRRVSLTRVMRPRQEPPMIKRLRRKSGPFSGRRRLPLCGRMDVLPSHLRFAQKNLASQSSIGSTIHISTTSPPSSPFFAPWTNFSASVSTNTVRLSDLYSKMIKEQKGGRGTAPRRRCWRPLAPTRF